ncbi:unnamed protein product [Orchesella dallaii]|uniref:DZF domain-containing protein n=1 Tax=Orchesella dallaii TaxID=48710 RepID=A0ABP1QFE1_9HEXA
MATNNYYGFTHGGTQYGNQYTPPQQGYTTAQPYPPPPQPPPVSQGAQPYPPPPPDNYVISGYTRPAQQSAGAQQNYYPQQNQQPTYTGQPMPPAGPPPSGKVPPQGPVKLVGASNVYPTYNANTAGSGTSYAGFTQPPQPPTTKGGTNSKANSFGFKRQGGGGGPHMNKMKGVRPMQNKPQTLHYCDVCKISCAGPQTYKEHLEGQKHKKKEAAQKVGGSGGIVPVAKGTSGGLRCELCDVTCTGSDAYAAHIRGAKHQKVLKLHTKLGKPIPSDNPTVIQSASANGQGQNQPSSGANVPLKIIPKQNQNPPFVKQPVPSAPKLNFIGPKADYDRYGQGLQQQNESGSQLQQPSQAITNVQQPQAVSQSPTVLGNVAPTNVDHKPEPVATVSPTVGFAEKDIQPVGQDYIEEVRSDDGKVVSFNCKLCECRFNDPNAKEMHMKGRRHRLQYKKKVNPDLVVDVKPSSRQKKMEERRASRVTPSRKNQAMGDMFQRGPMPLMPPGGGPRGFAPPVYGAPPGGPHMPFIPPLIRRPESMEDRHVMARHADIYPKEEELHAIQKIVSNTEKALKFVSDEFAETDAMKVNGVKDSASEMKSDADMLQASRVLKGVMRVGHLAKGLLLRGDRIVRLVVLCSEKPTSSMLDRIVEGLPKHFQNVSPDEKYEVTKKLGDAALVVSSSKEPKIEVSVTLTSPLMRTPAATGSDTVVAAGEAQATQVKDPADVLDKEKCLDALAELRHAKWFQARATTLQSCVIVIRILRDLCQRVAAWQLLPCWTVELLTEKAINSSGIPLSPGEALRIVLEVVSAGVFLQNGPGLLDPCEKESVDALKGLSNQCREDVTAYAQQALRQVAFRQIHKVLGMEPLPRFQKKNLMNRKRRRDNSEVGEGDDGDITNDGKKDKKEDLSSMDTEVAVKAESAA